VSKSAARSRAQLNEDRIRAEIPLAIRTNRLARGWTQAQLAERAGVEQSQVSALERQPLKDMPALETLKKIASAFDIGMVVRFVRFSDFASPPFDGDEP
jgi:transcriptional regulator with XRE-family HTH domain